ncbi:TerB family tellurite resistance protein [bacterium]|nr:TerB family tellurite resistance protein [bacterium]
MFKLSPEEIMEKQASLKEEAVEKLLSSLKSAQNLTVEPEKVQQWVESVYQNAVSVCKDASFEPDPPEPLLLPEKVALFILKSMIRIFSCKNDIGDGDLYFLGDVGAALNIGPSEIRGLLDDEYNRLRFYFTKRLLKDLDKEQCYWCALILMKIICADGYVHPAEETYFDIITQLIGGDAKNLEKLKAKAENTSEIPKLELEEDIARTMLKYVVIIAMSDGDYAGQESEFIKKAATSLGISQDKIDTILQPVASTFMVVRSMFPKEFQ